MTVSGQLFPEDVKTVCRAMHPSPSSDGRPDPQINMLHPRCLHLVQQAPDDLTERNLAEDVFAACKAQHFLPKQREPFGWHSTSIRLRRIYRPHILKPAGLGERKRPECRLKMTVKQTVNSGLLYPELVLSRPGGACVLYCQAKHV